MARKYIPVVLPSSPADQALKTRITGTPRVIRDIIADIFNTIQRWIDKQHDAGVIIQQICMIKSDNISQLSDNLEQQVNELYKLIQLLKADMEIIEVVQKQIGSLKKLPNVDEVFNTMTYGQIVDTADEIIQAYIVEFKNKVFVVENIAHVTSKDDLLFLASVYLHEIYITKHIKMKLEALLIETGHKPVS